MAGIQTAINITDGMTPAFKSMSNAMNIVMSNFETLQRQSGRAIDTSSITAARQELFRANAAITQVENNIRQSAAAQQNMNAKMREGSSVASSLVGKVGSMLAAYAGWQSALSLINLTDSYTGIKSRLDLINDGLQTTEELQEMVRQSANNTFSNYKDTADMVGKLGVQAGEAFTNNKDIINFAEQVNKHLSIAGTSTAAAQGAMIQLTQAMSNGVLRGGELNSVMDGMPTVAKAIRDEFARMGDTRGIKAIAEEGLITADVIKRALFNAADETNKKFASMGVTFSNVWNLFKNNADKALTPVYKKLGELTNSKDFQNFAVMAGQAVAILAGALIFVFETLAGLAKFVAQNWNWLAPILWGVTFALLAQGVAALWAKRQIVINAVMTAWKTICDWAATAAIIALTWAQNGFNAALAMCPLSWIIGLIIVVIVVIYLAVAAVNHFAGTSISATGIIAGAFMVLGTHIYNMVAFAWNTFASFAEFLINVFQNPIYSIKALFVNLASNFLDGCIAMTSGWDGFATSIANAFISAINFVIKAWNGLMDLLPDKVKSALGLGKGGEISATTSITSDLKGYKSDLQGMLGEKPSNYISIPKMEQKSLGGAWDTGYEWGKGVAESFSLDSIMEQVNGAQDVGKTAGTAEMLKNAGLGSGSPASSLGNGAAGKTAKNTGKTAGNTAKMADSLAASEEDIKLLRTIAEREVINRFTTAEIKIDMKNNNNIASSMDIDGVVSQLTDKLYNAMSVAAEGVHS